MAGSYELPFGAGRPFLKSMNRLAEGVIGGWKVTGHFYALLRRHSALR